MTFKIIMLILPWLLSVIGTGGIVGLIKKIKKDKTAHKEEIEKLNHKLAEEIRRFQEKQKQVTDLLEFQSNDNKIQSDMDKSIDLIIKAKTKGDSENALKKVSTSVRNIYNSR